MGGKKFQLQVFGLHLFGGQLQFVDGLAEFLIFLFELCYIVKCHQNTATLPLAVKNGGRIDHKGDRGLIPPLKDQAGYDDFFFAAHYLHPRQLLPKLRRIAAFPAEFGPFKADQFLGSFVDKGGKGRVCKHDLFFFIKNQDALLQHIKSRLYPAWNNCRRIQLAQRSFHH